MNSCPACEGYTDIKPCNNYCLNVMKGCLAYHIEIQTQWDEFVGKFLRPVFFVLANSPTF